MNSDNTFTGLEELCRMLNISEDVLTQAYVTMNQLKDEYNIEGKYWLGCALFVTNKIHPTAEHLMVLLEFCDLDLHKFLLYCNKWAEMNSESTEYIETLNKKMITSNICFKRFKKMFDNILVTSTNEDERKLRNNLFQFTWTFFSFVKGQFLNAEYDLVKSFYLLHGCLVCMIRSALSFDTKNLVDRKFFGTSINANKVDETLIDLISKIYDVSGLDVKGIYIHEVEPILRRFIKEGQLLGDSDTVCLDLDLNNMVSLYKQYLPLTAFDDRIFLFAKPESICKPAPKKTSPRHHPYQRIQPKSNEKVTNCSEHPPPIDLMSKLISSWDPIISKLIIDLWDSTKLKYYEKNGPREESVIKFAKKLFVRILEKETPDLNVFSSNIVHITLISVCLEISLFHNKCKDHLFPWVLDIHGVDAFHFQKWLPLIRRREDSFTKNIINHLRLVEETILASLAWCSNSSLWIELEKRRLSFPSCKSVLLPQQMEQGESVHANPVKGSIALFSRGFYFTAKKTLECLYNLLSIDENTRNDIWTFFEYVMTNKTELMMDRHVDQILMCCVYIIKRIEDQNSGNAVNHELFQNIIQCYKMIKPMSSSVYREVLLNSGNRKGVIYFFNNVFHPKVVSFAEQFIRVGNGDFRAPVPAPSPHVTPRKMLQVNVCTFNMEQNSVPINSNGTTYVVGRSPVNVMKHINQVVAGTDVRRRIVL